MNPNWIIIACEFVSTIDFGNEPVSIINQNHPRSVGLLLDATSSPGFLVVYNKKKNINTAVPMMMVKCLTFVEQQEARKKGRA